MNLSSVHFSRKMSFNLVLIVCLLLSTLFGNAASLVVSADPVQNTSHGLIEDFESYDDDIALGQAWTEAWSDKPGSVTRALGNSSGSKGLELSVAINDSQWANIIHAIPSDKRDWSKFDGLSFWVDNTTSDHKDFSLNIALQTPVAKGEFGLKQGGSALMITPDGSWQEAAFAGSSLNVPAGFKGVVRIAWDQFVQALWQCGDVEEECSAALDPGEVTALQFGYPPSAYINNVITIDDIMLYRAEKILDDFEAYVDDAALQNVWRVDWESGEPSALRTIDTVNVSNGSQAMKFSVSPPQGKPASDWVNIKRTAFTGADSDWSAFEGITFWVNQSSPSNKNMELNLSLVTDAPKGEFSLKEGGIVQFYHAADGWRTTTLGGASLSIAADYKGMIRIPWSALSQSTWQNCGACDAAFDASKVLQIQLGFNPGAQADNVLSIDEISLYALAGRASGSEGGPTTPPADHPSPPAWATTAGTFELAYQPAPVDNPLKGFLPFYDAAEEAYFTDGDDWRERPTQLPYSLEFFYLPLNRLMNNLDDFNWTELDKRLAEVASRGNQSVFRVYLDYPNKPSGIPQFLIDQGLTTYSYTEHNNGKDAASLAPDYNDERLLDALDNFISALGARYDGDPRIGSIMIGLIGFWGEWHTYPYDGNLKSPNLMPTDANMKRVLAAMDAAFDETQLVLRYPVDNDTLKTKEFDVGYHDDSFAFQTLPPSLGGQGWHFWGRINDAGVTDFWKQNSMGGEMRPEIQLKMWDHDPPRYNEPLNPIEGAQGEDYYTSLNLTHASWLITQGIFQTPLDAAQLARATEGSRRMGYEYYVPAAYLDAADGCLKIGVELENRGIAPFYYDWKVELAAQSDNGIVKIWEPDWKLKGILPNTNGFDNNMLLESIDNPQLSDGSYNILMRLVNPLEQINADAKKFHFANAEQNDNGWLQLGSVVVANSAAEAPISVTGLTASTPERIQLTPGESKEIEVTVTPAEAENKRTIWSSADHKVAYVSATGLVTAMGTGQTVITVKTSDGNLEKQFFVTVASAPSAGSGNGYTQPAAVESEVTDNGIKLGKEAAKLIRSTNEYGVTITSATIDAKKLQQAFRDLAEHSAAVKTNAVIIELENDGGSVQVNIPSLALAEAANEQPDVAILVQTDFASYKLPVQALVLAELAEKLGASLEEMTVSIIIDIVAGSTAELLSEQAKQEGLSLLAPAFNYKILAQANGSSSEIRNFGNSFVESTIALPAELEKRDLTALLFNPNTRSFHFVPANLQSSGGNSEITIKQNSSGIYMIGSGNKTFADIQAHWAKSEIELLASKRIVDGVSLNQFAPDAPITRAQFTALLVRSLGLAVTETVVETNDAYSDVAQGAWYADAVAIATEAGIVEGYSNGMFQPAQAISREQMAVMLSRALKYMNKSVQSNEQSWAAYTDNGSISPWAKQEMAELLTADIMKGKSETTLAPLSQATRAEVAVTIKRFLQFVQFID